MPLLVRQSGRAKSVCGKIERLLEHVHTNDVDLALKRKPPADGKSDVDPDIDNPWIGCSLQRRFDGLRPELAHAEVIHEIGGLGKGSDDAVIFKFNGSGYATKYEGAKCEIKTFDSEGARALNRRGWERSNGMKEILFCHFSINRKK